MAMNIHRSDTFQTQNQITLFTSTFDLVSHTPAIFKLIVWWQSTLMVHPLAVWRQRLLEYACYMVKSKVELWYFRWDTLLHQFFINPCKLMSSALKWKTSAIAHTVYTYFSSGFLHISLSSINTRCFVWGRDWNFKHLLDEVLLQRV